MFRRKGYVRAQWPFYGAIILEFWETYALQAGAELLASKVCKSYLLGCMLLNPVRVLSNS